MTRTRKPYVEPTTRFAPAVPAQARKVVRAADTGREGDPKWDGIDDLLPGAYRQGGMAGHMRRTGGRSHV